MLEPTPSARTRPPPLEEGATDLREYVAVLRARKWSIATMTLLTVGAAMFFSFRQTPIYESEAQVLVNPIPFSGFSSAPPAAPNLETERIVATSSEVADLAAERLGGAVDPQDLAGNLVVEVATNSEVLVFRYADPGPLEAQRRAQAFAEGYLESRRVKALDSLLAATESIQQRIEEVTGDLRQVNRKITAATDQVARANLQTEASRLSAELAVLEQRKSEIAPGGELSVGDIIAEAKLPTSPARPNHILNGALALLVGLALGVGLAFLRERLDDRLRGQGDLEARAGAPVLAVVPHVPRWKKRKETPLVTLTDPRSGPSEAYRTLRTSLLFAAEERGVRSILVTSPHPGEGKTATAANLAVVLSQAGRRVIAVSADLRKPRLHRFFGTDNTTGLSGLLTGEDGFGEALRDVGLNGMRMIPSGPVPQNPAELVGSLAMGKALERFGEAAELVVIDAPPILDVADAVTLASLADAVVLVADAEKTSRSALSHARKQLEQVRAEVIGAVLNNLDPTKARTYPYYYRYGYRYIYEPEKPDGLGQEGPRVPPQEPSGRPAAIPAAEAWQAGPAPPAGAQPPRRPPSPPRVPSPEPPLTAAPPSEERSLERPPLEEGAGEPPVRARQPDEPSDETIYEELLRAISGDESEDAGNPPGSN